MMKSVITMQGAVFTALLLISSCTSDDTIVENNEQRCSIMVVCDEFKDGDYTTRVAIDLSTGSPIFPFLDTDTLGIFPATGDQVSFPLSGSAGSTSATFDGGGWRLKDGMTYYAYLPFSRVNYSAESQRNKIPISFLGQKQTTPNSTSEIGNYVYMSSEGAAPENSMLRFQLHHVGALARVGITVPAAATYSKLYILAEDDVFFTEGTLNLASDEVTLTPVRRSNRIELNLSNQKFASSDVGSSYNYYMMIPPCDCSNQSLRIVMIDSYGNTYTAPTRVGKTNNFVAGHYYGFTMSGSFVKESGSTGDDDGNIGFLVESNEMANEDVNIKF